MIQKVLIANRGEIAVRVMRSCKEMGIRTVAVFSEADRTARHVMYADEACLIGPAASKDSYLNIDNIIKAAKQHHADAIHPGYGFLSENADFARRCKEEGIIFIGPAAETMEAMGDKIAARKRMIAAGVPVVPGTEQPLQSAEEAVRICNEIGYPVMLKASMGGGGKGMRVAQSPEEFRKNFRIAQTEAKQSFGDGAMYLEHFLTGPKHVEVQILADRAGNTIYLGERDCSMQRRHQKVLEEAGLDYGTEALSGRIGTSVVENTAVFYVYTYDSDPYRAMELANAIGRVAPKEIGRIVKSGGIEVIDYATLPEAPYSSTSLVNYALVGFAGCFGASFVLFLLAGLMDTTIRRRYELKLAFRIPVLGDIPQIQAPDRKSKPVLVLGENSSFAVRESYNTIRANLLFTGKENVVRSMPSPVRIRMKARL